MRGLSEGFSTSSSKLSLGARVKRLFRYRRILDLMVRRDLKVRYAGTALGYLWSVLDPLIMTIVFWFLFTKIFHRHIGYDPYILFLVTGQLIWAWFNGGVNQVAKALRSQAQMVKSSNVPRELWVLRVVVSKGVEYVFSLPVIAIFAIAYLFRPHWQIVFLPLAMFMCATLVMGVGLILAPLTVLVRDTDRFIPIIMRVLFYCSPIIYSIQKIPENLRFVYNFNPTVGMLVLSRSMFFPQELRWNYVADSAAITAVILAIGIVVFTRLERPVLKEI